MYTCKLVSQVRNLRLSRIRSPFVGVFLAVLLIGLLGQPVAADIYVSPDGNDHNPGTQSQPVRTAEQALKLSIQEADPVIQFADGVYYLDRPLEIDPQCSGSAKRVRELHATNEGQVIFSAGRPVQLGFKPYRDGILQAEIPQEFDLGQGVDGFFVRGQFQRMARYPNYDRDARWFKGSSGDSFSKERIDRWSDPTGGYVHAMHPAHWGGNHWRIAGKNDDGSCRLEGGWMNNRGGGIHPKDRFVENIFEELDDHREWFLDQKRRIIYWKPAEAFAESIDFSQPVEGVFANNESIVRLLGDQDRPVKHIRFDGISFRHTARTFMKTKEPLLRSDWRIYRNGAIFLNRCEKVEFVNCEFTNLGGNAFFASGQNLGLRVAGSHFHQIGASAICFVGLTSAVHNPLFDPYGPATPWKDVNKVDRANRTSDFPSDCIAEDCLIHDIGLVEKQVAGLQISVAARIIGRHLSIYDVPRAGINIGENAFGGHLIEHCDVFDTVQESSDHGSFNSWGRDRFWHTDYPVVDEQVAEHPSLPKIDMVSRNVIRNSRWRCDHGWDIDLDDGSSWYLVENNLCLGGGIKLREGYYRTVRNNMIVANTFHPHVWFKRSEDEFYGNLVATPYQPIRLTGKGRRWDSNYFLSSEALQRAQNFGVDKNSRVVDLEFRDVAQLDFRTRRQGQLAAIGFKPFELTQFGVQKKSLKKLARTPTPPTLLKAVTAEPESVSIVGAELRSVYTDGDVSATGLDSKRGVLVEELDENGILYKKGIRRGDVLLSVANKPVDEPLQFVKAWAAGPEDDSITAGIWRSQAPGELSLGRFPGQKLTSADAKIKGTAFYDKTKGYIGRWTDSKTQIAWDLRLKPNQKYRVLIDAANPLQRPSRWQVEGFQTPLKGVPVKTKHWESFELFLLDGTGLAPEQERHQISLVPLALETAVMNVRSVILIED